MNLRTFTQATLQDLQDRGYSYVWIKPRVDSEPTVRAKPLQLVIAYECLEHVPAGATVISIAAPQVASLLSNSSLDSFIVAHTEDTAVNHHIMAETY